MEDQSANESEERGLDTFLLSLTIFRGKQDERTVDFYT